MSTVGSTCAVILAAGKGTRMKSSLPKVLHPLMGKPVLSWVIAAVKDAGVSEIALVLGSDTTRFQQLLKENPGVRVAVQKGQKGTGDAVASASGAFIGVTTPSYAEGELRVGSPIKAEWLLVVTGDTPAISAKTLKEFIASTLHSGKRLGVLGMEMPDPRGYGRLIKGPSGGLTKIVEERDADSETRKIQLCNSGIMMAKASWLFELLGQVAPHNSQNEYYLTDIFLLAANSQAPAHIFETKSDHEFAGINDRMQLEALEEWMLERRRRDMMSSGVTLHLPNTIYVESDVVVEQDVEIFAGVSLLGTTRVSRGVQIGAGAVLQDVDVGAGGVIGANAVLTKLKVMAGSKIPPGMIRTDMDF